MISQIFVAIGVAIVASVLVTGLASTINAQSNMTGGNMSMPAAGTTGDDGSDNGDDGDGSDDGDGDDGNGENN
jgi:hypothetical protein